MPRKSDRKGDSPESESLVSSEPLALIPLEEGTRSRARGRGARSVRSAPSREEKRARRRRVRAAVDTVTPDPAYMKIARGFRAARFLSFALLIVFVLTMLTVYSREITFENFRYLFKTLDINFLSSPDEFSDIGYEVGDRQSFTLLDGNFVELTEGGVRVYDRFATTLLDEARTLLSPALDASEKTLLVYDRSGTEYARYNSFSCLHEGKTDFPIMAADVCDEGSYALVSRNLRYLSEIVVYDDHDHLTAKLQKDKYVTSVRIDPEGQLLATLAVEGDSDGRYLGELQVTDLQEGEVLASAEILDELPLRVDFLAQTEGEEESGARRLCVLTDRMFRYYDLTDAGLTQVGSASFSADNAEVYAVGDRLAAVCESDGGIGAQCLLRVFDRDGAQIASYSVAGQPVRIAAVGERFYLLTSERLYRGDLAGEFSSITASGEEVDILPYEQAGVLFVCTPGRARVLRADTFDAAS